MTPEEQEYLKTIALFAAGAGVIGGAAVSAIAILINGWRQRIADTRRHKADTDAANMRHFRDLALQAAVADWKHHVDAAESWRPMKNMGLLTPKVDPLDFFLIKKLHMIQTFGDGTISTANMSERLEEIREIHQHLSPKK